MPIIPSSVTWPTLSDFQVQFQGTAASAVTFGPLPFYIKSKGMEGFDLPATRTGDTKRPRGRGEFIGLDLFSGRDITLTFDVGGTAFGSYTSLADCLSSLRAVTNTADDGDVEYPMFVKFPGLATLGIMARARKRAFNPTIAMALGNLAEGYIAQFHATDPFFYGQTQSNTLDLPTPVGGAAFPWTFPLSFGGGGSPTTVTLTNNGDVECYPQLTINGPCTYPSISNNTSGNVLEFGVTMNSGDTLDIDMDLKTATYTASGATQSYSLMSTLQPGWSWWSLAPGDNQIEFTSIDSTHVSGNLVIAWADAYSSAV